MAGTFSDSLNWKNQWHKRIPTRGNMFQIGGNTFYDQKNEIPLKILEFKRLGIGIIMEFCQNPNGYSNQAVNGGNGNGGLC
jgi:hypothetical protein